MAYSPEGFDEVLCFDLDNHRNLVDCIMISSFLLALQTDANGRNRHP